MKDIPNGNDKSVKELLLREHFAYSNKPRITVKEFDKIINEM